MIQISRMLVMLALFLMIISVNKSDAKTAIAAIKDSGCNSHKQLHIEQEHKDIQIKDTYIKWEG